MKAANTRAAAALGDAIERATDLIREHPESGRPGRVAGTRELPVVRTPNILVYVRSGDRVEIARLLHGAQNWPSEE
ncbi:MAG: type II toxin-antitoxin system RelE/ParE family toxin [Pseudomonadota bacterium]|nr:type II toxin-antitoxin system RelE/ParE family toxin [Pseudomonadota bacterium]